MAEQKNVVDKKLCKNVEFLMSGNAHDSLLEHLSAPTNEWLGAGLQSIVETDENGLIIMFRPSSTMTMGIVHFFQTLMLEQRCYLMDNFLRKQGEIK